MIISNFAIDRATTILVLLLILVLAGIYSYAVLPRENNPEVVVPFITVDTHYEGVAAEDMESLVTIPIERELAGIAEIKQIESNSVEGHSSIVVEFTADTDVDSALQKVRDKVDLAKPDIPADADEPIVAEINLAELPIYVISLLGDYPLAVLNSLAEDIEDELESVQGVLDVGIIGGVEREIQIVVDPDRVAEYGVSFASLIRVTQLENVNTPGGTMELGEAKYLMRTPGEIQHAEELDNLIVKQGPAGVVHLRDLAKARDGFKDIGSKSRVDGKPAVTLTISKRSGENIIEVVDRIKAELARFERRLPPGVEIVTTWDESTWVRDMVSELENSILSGLLLVLAVIFVFLGLSNAVFVSLAIPVSMLITFAVLYFLGVTLNTVVLFSLTLALGMLVDNGIVVVENIYRHVQEGKARIQAAKEATAEVAWPIIGATATTVTAFVPMFFWPGIWGEFMVYLPLTVCTALIASLFVGLIINPTLAAMFMRPRPSARGEHPIGNFFLGAYERILRTALAWRFITITLAVAVLLLIGGIFGAYGKTVFTPEIEPPQAYIDIEAPEGTNLDTSDGIVSQVERLVAPYEEHIEHVIANVGSMGFQPMGDSANTTHQSRVTIDFPPLDQATLLPSRVIEEIRTGLQQITGAETRIGKMDMGPPTEPPVNVELSGDDYDTLARLAEETRRLIRGVDGLVDLRDDYSKGKPEVQVIVDRQQAWQTGLSTQTIGLTIQAAVNGIKASEYREGEEEYDVTVMFPDSFRSDLRNVMDMNLINEMGQAVPLNAVARLEQGAGMGSIKRIDRKRTVTVSADVDGRTAPEVLADVQQIIDKNLALPPGYTVAYTGENEDTEETQAFLVEAFAAAVFLITFVLVAQFNSITQPLIIMSSVVLSLAGVFLGLLLFEMPFSILMTGIGCISLAGVVVNNAIVLIDFINMLRAEGKPCTEAIIEAGRTRFRPVLLTAITTILGLIPMAIGFSIDFGALATGDFANFLRQGGESSQWWGPMAVAVIFGLTFATVLTLVVVPALYSLIDSFVSLFRREKSGYPGSAEPAEVPVE